MITSFRDEDAKRCVNCGIRLFGTNYLQVSSLADDKKQLLTDWLPMVENLQDCVICRECAPLLETAAGAARTRRRGHAAVCASCGDSVVRRRKTAVLEDHPVYPVLAPYFYHFRGEDFKYACRVCIVRASRMFERKTKDRRSGPYIDPCLKDNPAAVAEIQRAWENSTIPNTSRHIAATPSTATSSTATPSTATRSGAVMVQTKVDNLMTLSYHKLAIKTNTCAAECQNKGDKLASLFTRQQLLIQQSLYAPLGTRVCPRHQKFTNWAEIARPPGNFTGEEIADMLYLLKRDRAVDFSDVEKMDSQLRRKWLGVSLEKFDELYEKSSLRDKLDGKFALALALASAHTGEPEFVLASVGQRSLRAVQAALKLASFAGDMDAARTALEALKYEEMD